MDKGSRFTLAVESNKDRIYRLCCCYVSKEDERKDVYQEVLIHIWRSLDKFEGRSDIGTWIYRITVNTCLGYLRGEERRKKVFDDASSVEDAEISDRIGEEDPAQTESDVQRLYACVAELQVVDKALISLYLEDLSTKEMADILEISEANVRVKLHRIKKTLKKMLEAKGHGSE